MNYHYIFNEFADLLANMAPSKVLSFRTSKKSQSRLQELLEKNNTIGLSKTEQAEVEQFMLVEHILSLAKIKALKLID